MPKMISHLRNHNHEAVSTISFIKEKIFRRLRRELIRHSTNPRPSSEPYISGDGFRAMSHHVFEAESLIQPERVKAGDIVFVQSDMLERFFDETHPHIPAPYILITGNSDASVTEKDALRIDEKILHWFAQNVMTAHPKLTPIPIGLENAKFAHAGRIKLFKDARRKMEKKGSMTKNGRILLGFNISTNPRERTRALEQLKSNPLTDRINQWLPQSEYVEMLQTYSFVASPHGNGIDCHRTWEALYVNTVPIVQSSICMEYFKGLGIGIHTIDSWADLCLEKVPRAKQTDALFMDYWKKKIEAFRTNT